MKAHENIVRHEVDCPPVPEDRAVSEQPTRAKVVLVTVIIRVVATAACQKAAVVARAVRVVVVCLQLALAVEIVCIGAEVCVGEY